MIKEVAKFIFKYPMMFLNRIYTKSYYGKGLRSPNYKLDDIGSEDIVIIAPHLADETIGLGGSLLKYRDLDSRKTLVYVTRGDQEEQAREIEEISRIYRLDRVEFLNLDSGGVEAGSSQALPKLVEILRETRPGKIFTPFLFDGSSDHIESTRLLMRALEAYDRDFKDIWMYEINTPNDLRIINRVNSLTREDFLEKRKIYRIFKSRRDIGFDVYSLMDRNKALLAEGGAYGSETFIKISLATAKEVEEMLREKGFRPDYVERLESQFSLPLAFMKNKGRKMIYNNNLNYLLKGKFAGVKGEE